MSMAGSMSTQVSAALLATTSPQSEESLFWLLVALLTVVVLFGSFCSCLLVRHLARRWRHERENSMFWIHPFRFGSSFTFPGDYPCRWLAIQETNPRSILEALRISRATPCSWEEGLARTFEQKLFVSPPIKGWIVVLGTALPDPALDVDVCFRFLTQLSQKLGSIQFFNMNRALDHHGWAMLDKGEVVRAYAWAGTTLWNQGALTPAEKSLGLRCLDYGSAPELDAFMNDGPMAANTAKVPMLAARWSLDPAVLARRMMDERRGLTGELPLSRPV